MENNHVNNSEIANNGRNISSPLSLGEGAGVRPSGKDGIIVGLGEALWDCLPEGRKIGGAPANFAYHASQFGFDAYAVSAVGNDELGDETVEALKSNGLKLVMPRVDFPTGQVQVSLDAEGVATYDIKEGSAWDNIPFTPEIQALAK